MTNLHAEPAICPACGELVIVTGTCTLIVPPHLDRVMPGTSCVASARAIKDGKILQG